MKGGGGRAGNVKSSPLPMGFEGKIVHCPVNKCCTIIYILNQVGCAEFAICISVHSCKYHFMCSFFD